MATENKICFEILVQEFDTLFDYTLQEGSKLKLLDINIVQGKYGISIDQTDHIMKNFIQEYWGGKQEMKLNFSNHHSQQKPHFKKHSSW